MKKFLFSALAAGALAFGGAASAQDIGGLVANILGFGAPMPGNNVIISQPCASTYFDLYNRPVCVDHSGRHIVHQSNMTGGPVDRRWNNYAYQGNAWDADGDGIANTRDRRPHDPRYR